MSFLHATKLFSVFNITQLSIYFKGFLLYPVAGFLTRQLTFNIMNGAENRMKVRPMSISEICNHLDINRDTFFKWIDAKESLPYRIGHLLKFKNEDDDELLKQWFVDVN